LRDLLNSYRYRLIRYDSVMAYALLGVVGGAASGLVVLAFGMAIRSSGWITGPGSSGDGANAGQPAMTRCPKQRGTSACCG